MRLYGQDPTLQDGISDRKHCGGRAHKKLYKPIYCDFGRDIICMRADGKHNFLDQIAEEHGNRMAYVATSDLGLSNRALSIDVLRLPGLKELMIGRAMYRLPEAIKGWDREMDRVWSGVRGSAANWVSAPDSRHGISGWGRSYADTGTCIQAERVGCKTRILCHPQK